MAPTKFGLFKARSRDYPDQPSTENLIHTSYNSDQVTTPTGETAPIPSTSKGVTEEDAAAAELSTLRLYSQDDDDEDDGISPVTTPSRSISACSRSADSEAGYHPLKSFSLDVSSTPRKDQGFDDASTTYDANSLQFDETSITKSDNVPVLCGTLKKNKKIQSKTERHLRDLKMWKASNVEVMQKLLTRSGTLDEQIKWEAIATARGLCTLTDNCTCGDCTNCKFLAGMADGDGGLGAAPLFSAINLGCRLQ